MYQELVQGKMDQWVDIEREEDKKKEVVDAEHRRRFVNHVCLGLLSEDMKEKILAETSPGGEIGDRLVDNGGKFQKRFIKWFFKHLDLCLDPEVVSKSFRDSRAEEELTKVGSLKITKDITWDQGTYGDKNSCFWTCHSHARIFIKHDPHFYGCIFKTESGHPMGRVWMYVHEEGITLWNAYPSSKYMGMYAEHLKKYLGIKLSRDQQFYNEGDTGGWLYINNSGRGKILTNRLITERRTDGRFDSPETDEDSYVEYGGNCTRCGRPVWTDIPYGESEPIEIPSFVGFSHNAPVSKNPGKRCFRCNKLYPNNEYRCDCGATYPSDEYVWANSMNERKCPACIDYPCIVSNRQVYKAGIWVRVPEELRGVFDARYLMKRAQAMKYLGNNVFMFNLDINSKSLEESECMLVRVDRNSYVHEGEHDFSWAMYSDPNVEEAKDIFAGVEPYSEVYRDIAVCESVQA